jgi:hypothetical protein
MTINNQIVRMRVRKTVAAAKITRGIVVATSRDDEAGLYHG